MEGCLIIHTAVVRKEHLLGKRQRLATEEVKVLPTLMYLKRHTRCRVFSTGAPLKCQIAY